MKKKAFTLVEVMIVIAILGILSIGVISLFKSTRDLWDYSDQQVDVQQSARNALNEMSKYIKQAKKSEVNVGTSSIEFYDSSDRYHKFWKSGDKLYERFGVGGSTTTRELVRGYVQNIVFEVIGATDAVRISSFTITKRDQSLTLSRQVRVRTP